MPKEFMDEIMDTVVSDLNKPKSKNLLCIPFLYDLWGQKYLLIKFNNLTYQGYRYFEKTVSIGSFGCNIITGLLVAFSVIFALNFVFGIGKHCENHLL